jgi:ABC-2 type transport system permease protein
VLWGYVFGLTVASTALSFASTYKTSAQRAHLVTLFGDNAGIAAIAGPARQIQTVAGFTVWKTFMFLGVVGAIWGLLTGTRLLRGEEDAGRWELLLAGQTTRRRAAAQALAGLGAGLVVLWALTAVISVVAGQYARVDIAAGPSLFFALALVCPAAVFLAGGALASQLAPNRRQAASYAGVALGAAYALRMVADSSSGLAWLHWATPLGWAEELRPLTAPRPLVLLPIASLVVLLGGLSTYLAGVRDLGASVLPDRQHTRARTRLLNGPVGLAVRLARPVVLGWAAAICAVSLLMGSIAKQGGSALKSSAGLERAMQRLGVRGGGAAQYLEFTFLTVALMLCLIGAGQLSAARAEEAEGRLDHLLVRQARRSSWLAGRAGLAAVVLAGCALLAAVFTWFGAVSNGAGVDLSSLVEAGANVVAPGLCLLGLGFLALGAAPRAASAVTYGLLSWSFLIELVGGFFSSNHWLLDTSVFHQMAPAPAVSPDWTSLSVLVTIGVAAAVAGGACFRRRDLAGE